jgi:AAA domain
MSIATLILGESGTGKTTSLRNLDPKEVLLIQSVKKPLPFKMSGWKYLENGATSGSIFVSDQSDRIINAITKTQKKIIVIDDFQYVLANEFMRRSGETGFTKFMDIGKHAWDILDSAIRLPDDVRVYILSHTQTSDLGKTSIKTIGKLLDEKITIEGMFTCVLRTQVSNGNYLFSTQNNGQDTTKSPMGMFDSELIENDLKMVDGLVSAYYQPATA